MAILSVRLTEFTLQTLIINVNDVVFTRSSESSDCKSSPSTTCQQPIQTSYIYQCWAARMVIRWWLLLAVPRAPWDGRLRTWWHCWSRLSLRCCRSSQCRAQDGTECSAVFHCTVLFVAHISCNYWCAGTPSLLEMRLLYLHQHQHTTRVTSCQTQIYHQLFTAETGQTSEYHSNPDSG